MQSCVTKRVWSPAVVQFDFPKLTFFSDFLLILLVNPSIAAGCN